MISGDSKVNKWISAHRILSVIIAVVLFLFAVAGVPIIINESYKVENGFTLWDATDVLSYYGTILGAFVTLIVAVLTITITLSFNRKQIQRDSYLKHEKEKWEKVEETIARVLDSINPQRMIMFGPENGDFNSTAYFNTSIFSIQKYQVDCKIATDQLQAYLSLTDYPKVSGLLDHINQATKEFCRIAEDKCFTYGKLRDLSIRPTAERVVMNETLSHNSIAPEIFSFYIELLERTRETKHQDVWKEIGIIETRIVDAYLSIYRELLSLKGQTFDIIYAEMLKCADEVLLFTRNR